MTKRTKAPARAKPAPNGNGEARRIGRPSMFEGKDLSQHKTPYMTSEGWAAAEALIAHHATKVGFVPSFGDVVEDALRARATDLLRKR